MNSRQGPPSVSNQKTVFWRRIIKFGLLLFLGVGFVSLINWWRATQIFCLDSEKAESIPNCPAQQLLLNQSMLLLDLDKPSWLALKIITDDQGRNWSLVSWSKKLPQTVKLRYILSPSKYILTQNNEFFSVSTVGRVQSISQDNDLIQALPMVEVSSGWPETLVSNGQIAPNFDLWANQVWQLYLPSAESKPTLRLNDVFQAKLVWSTWELIFTPMIDPSLELERYKLVRESLQDTNQQLGKNYRSLDVRFKLPVLLPVGIGADIQVDSKKIASESAIIAAPTKLATKSGVASPSAKPKNQN